MNEELFEFIRSCPDAYHTVDTLKKELIKNGFAEIFETEKCELTPGKAYFVTRNGSSLIAFRLPENNFSGFMITASHADSPAFKIKEDPVNYKCGYRRLSVEKYGGMLCSTWLDKPLSMAGRVIVSTDDGIKTVLVDSIEPVAIIPNVAIHMNRGANESSSFNAAIDMQPVFSTGGEETSFKDVLTKLASCRYEDILSTDLILYNPADGVVINDMISAPRLDDLQCVFPLKEAFLYVRNPYAVNVLAVFDNEEVGSATKQGAASTFLYETLYKISASYGDSQEDFYRKVANSFMLSCDNAHAYHPNHPEYYDVDHTCALNGGIVIKFTANQRYASDGVSAALFKKIAETAGVPTQVFYNKADVLGGSTLGNISNTVVSLNTVDIGLAQLAMHSAFETAGAKDTEYMFDAVSEFYTSHLKFDGDKIAIL